MEILTKQFGLLIAYLLPGFIALAGIAPLVPTVAGWLKADQTASFGAPLYALLAATAAGMVVSCFRWLILDWIHVLTGVTPPRFNARALAERTRRVPIPGRAALPILSILRKLASRDSLVLLHLPLA